MKEWDVFISHASEDKQTIALPLAESLVRSGLKVWLDRFELRVGDSLREKIDEGLSKSAFGIVILSEHFLTKGWPKKELNGLFALEESGVKVILPVWHGLDKATVAQHSPILADRLAADTKEGIPVVARRIAQVILEEGARLRPAGDTLASQLVAILNQGHSPTNLSTFLTTYPKVLPTALGHFGLWPDRAVYRVEPGFGSFKPDLAVGSLMNTAGDWMWCHLYFGPIEGRLFEQGIPVEALKETIERMELLKDWLSRHSAEAVKVLVSGEERLLPRVGSDRHMHQCIIIGGRRDRLSESDREGIRSLMDRTVRVRSYDWLIEACAMAE